MSGRELFLPLKSQAYALGRPPHSAKIKQRYDDFIVAETLGFEPSGSGEHVMLLIEKSGQSTREAVQMISRILAIQHDLRTCRGSQGGFAINLDPDRRAQLVHARGDLDDGGVSKMVF